MKTKKKLKEKLIAKKDFVIFQNNEKYVIKKGDDIDKLNIPSRFFDNLKTEKII